MKIDGVASEGNGSLQIESSSSGSKGVYDGVGLIQHVSPHNKGFPCHEGINEPTTNVETSSTSSIPDP